jgi:hypothetical protein
MRPIVTRLHKQGAIEAISSAELTLNLASLG